MLTPATRGTRVPSTEPETAIRREQARSLRESLPLLVLGNALGAFSAYLTFLDSGTVSQVFLSVWLAVMVVVVLAGVHGLRNGKDDGNASTRWFHAYELHVGLHGLIWTALGVAVVSSGSTAYQFVILVGASMLATGAMSSLGTYFPAYRTYLFCLLLPTTLAMLAQWSLLHVGMSMAALVFVAFMLLAGKRFNASYCESLRLRFENLDLIEALTAQKEAAEAANQAKSRFLAAASHDLRQPMHALNLYHDALDNQDQPPESRALLTHARQCAEAMGEMFDALLDMSRLDAGAVTPRVQVFPVADLLQRILGEFKPLAREKGLMLRHVRSSCCIRSDPALVERIVRNFVANAVRYTAAGTVLVGCRRRGGRVRIAVFDTGQGIPADRQQAVFEEYFQLNNPERDRSKGLGLGLAIVRRLADLLAAPITLHSVPGRGSMFAVDFPAYDCAEEPVASPAKSPQWPPRANDLHGRLLVVIDDETMIQEALSTVLQQWGCRVLAVASGAEAVARLALSPVVPDALICDYRLRGGETGVMAVEALRAEFCADIPALLVTGDTSPERLQEITRSGLPVLHKPVASEVLYAELLRLIGRAPAAE